MKVHDRPRTRRLTLLVGAIALIAIHVILFNHLRHASVSLAVLSGLVLLVIIKHLGALGPLYTLFRRRSRSKHE